MMNRFLCCTGCCLLALLASAPSAWAQQRNQPPRIGYVCPAGGRQGDTFEATIGGQYLGDDATLHISGQDVQLELLDYIRPATQREIAQIREIWREAQEKVREEAKAGGPGPGRAAVLRLVLKMAEEQGITRKQLAAFDQYRKDRADPKRQLNPQLSESIKVRITVSADAEPGTRELRITTPLGLSNPLRFCIGQLPEVSELEPNDAAPSASVVPSLPAVLNGQIMPGDVDRFRLKARQGQRLVVRVSARDLIPYLADAVPGWFQATVALYDADGHEVAYADDYRFDPDPVLLYEVPRDGNYVLEITDSIYRGREDFVYRITVGELPFVSGVFPLGAQRGERTTVAVDGWNLPPDQLKQQLRPEATGIQTLHVRGPAGVSNVVPLAIDDLPELREEEPNDDASSAGKLSLPLVVNGRIDKPGDWDVFRFDARAGDELVAEVEARRLGSPLDSLLRLTDEKGNVLAINDDHEDKACGLVTHHADSLLLVKVPKTGTYGLWLGDTQHKGGPTYGYRLRVGPKQPDFELRVAPSAINIQAGTTVEIAACALRRDGFAGDIQLSLKDAPEGFILDGGWIPAGQDAVRLTLTVPFMEQQKLIELQLEGQATIGGREVRRPALPADDMMQAFIYRHLVPAETWTVAVSPGRWRRAQLKVLGEQPVRLVPGRTVKVRLETPNRVIAGQIRLELSDPPEGIAIEKVTPQMRDVVVELSVKADKVKPGLKGNLIVNVFVERPLPPKEGETETKTRRTPLGTLPAISFEAVQPGDPRPTASAARPTR